MPALIECCACSFSNCLSNYNAVFETKLLCGFFFFERMSPDEFGINFGKVSVSLFLYFFDL